MRHPTHVAWIGLVLTPVLGGGPIGCEAQSPAADLSWLAGDWSADAWGGRLDARYLTARGGHAIGYSRLMRDATQAYFEFEVFEPAGGGVRLTPYPRGQRATSLFSTLIDPNAEKAVFENMEKDYPTRIVYQRTPAGELVVTLDDPHGLTGKREVFEFAAVDATP